MALRDRAALVDAAAKGEQVEVTRDELHRHQPLLGAFLVAAARDDGAGGDDVALVAEQRDQAKLRLDVARAGADFNRAVLVLLDARGNDFGERLERGLARLVVALVGTDVRDRLEPEAAL